MTLALVRDMREPSSADEVADFETDVLAGFVLARASAGLADSTIRKDTDNLDLIRGWFGRPLWELQPEDADAYFGRVLRNTKPATRAGRASALTVYFQFLELRHKVEIYNLTGRVVDCPLDEMNRPPMAWIDWHAVITALDGGRLPASSEKRIVRIAASLAVGHLISLRDAIPGLDQRNTGLVTTAIRRAAGR